MITPLMPVYTRSELAFDHGEGARVTTVDGREYLDFGSGIAVNGLGHAHPHLVKALGIQAQKLWHTSNLYRIPEGEKLAARLCEVTFADTVFFTNSGAEAIECAIKMARKFHSASGQGARNRIITFEGAFHGRTLATLAAGGQEKHLDGFGPKADGFDQAPFGDLDAVKAIVDERTAAILVEPVQGEGGIRPLSGATLKALRRICDDAGILLIFDEIQCGMGRTGKMFAHEWAGIMPDIMAIAKSIGGGFPLGACLASEHAAHGMTAGTHGSTFGGNPLAMAVGNAVLDVVLEPDFLTRVNDAAKVLGQKLSRLKDEYPDVIADVRGMGLMIGIVCKVPNTALVNACAGEHLLTVGAGGNVMRLLPPLIVSDDDIDDAARRIERACRLLAAPAGEAGQGI